MFSGVMNHTLSDSPIDESWFNSCQENDICLICLVTSVKFGAEDVVMWGKLFGSWTHPLVEVKKKQTKKTLNAYEY